MILDSPQEFGRFRSCSRFCCQGFNQQIDDQRVAHGQKLTAASASLSKDDLPNSVFLLYGSFKFLINDLIFFFSVHFFSPFSVYVHISGSDPLKFQIIQGCLVDLPCALEKLHAVC